MIIYIYRSLDRPLEFPVMITYSHLLNIVSNALSHDLFPLIAIQ